MKEKIRKLLGCLVAPSAPIIAVAFVLCVLFVALALSMLLVDYVGTPLEILAYVSFALAAITFGYTVYILVRHFPRFKRALSRAVDSNRITRTLKENYGIRTLTAATVGFLTSIAYGIFNGALGILYLSVWYGALAAYHIVIAFVRGGTVLVHVRSTRLSTEGLESLRRARSYRNSGILMLSLNLALSSAIAQMIFEDRFFEYPDWTVFAYAAYAFYKITMSVINMVRSRASEELTVHAVRDINLIDAAVSVLALQTALLHAFTDGSVDISLFNTLTGSAVSLTTLTLSVFMIVKANKRINKIKTELNNAG